MTVVIAIRGQQGPVITPASPPAAIAGVPYTYPFSATEGTPPYAWSLTSNTPDPVAPVLSPGGVLTWTPGSVSPETEVLNLKVTDAHGLIGTATVYIPAAGNFPLLGGYLEGGNTTPLTPAHVAPLNVMVLGAYLGWTNVGNLNPGQFAAAAQAINPNFRMFIYNIIESDFTNPPGQTDHAPIGTVPYWLYAINTTPPIITGQRGLVINIMSSLLHNGLDYVHWRAGLDVADFITPFAPVSGLFIDNFLPCAVQSGDYELIGSTQSDANSNLTLHNLYRTAYVNYVNAVRTASAPTQQMLLANVAEWYTSGSPSQISNISNYQGLCNGGVMESLQGQDQNSGGGGTPVGWFRVMADYSTVMNAFAAPKYGIFQWDNVGTNYVMFRYSYCSCLLDNGYYFANNFSNNDYGVYDEFSFNLGAPIAGPNNPTNGTYSSGALTAWKQGVYRRDFANGIALVNPRGNGAQTVVVDASVNYWHLRGTQDPTTNNAAEVVAGGTVTLPDSNVAGTGGSGLVLSRTAT